MNDRNAKAMMAVAIGSVLFGFLGILVRTLNGYGLDAFDLVMARFSFSALGLVLAVLIVKRSAFRVNGRKDILYFFLFGLFKFLSDIAYVNAQITIDLSIATLLFMMTPYYVLILSYVIFKERITVRKALAVLIGFTGSVLVTGIATDGIGSMENVFGTICAFLSGVFFSVYIMGCGCALPAGTHR